MYQRFASEGLGKPVNAQNANILEPCITFQRRDESYNKLVFGDFFFSLGGEEGGGWGPLPFAVNYRIGISVSTLLVIVNTIDVCHLACRALKFDARRKFGLRGFGYAFLLHCLLFSCLLLHLFVFAFEFEKFVPRGFGYVFQLHCSSYEFIRSFPFSFPFVPTTTRTHHCLVFSFLLPHLFAFAFAFDLLVTM